MKTVLLEGKFKVGIVRETPYSVLVVALEDALVVNSSQRLALMVTGRRYWFCRCCYEKRIKSEVSL